jgi:replicative superfamily II helicase
MDVGRFINATEKSIFYFDQSYRPTPLKTSFYGLKNVGNTQRMNSIMTEICYTNILRVLKMGKQAIIFVHKRSETVSTAKDLIELIKKRGTAQMF